MGFCFSVQHGMAQLCLSFHCSLTRRPRQAHLSTDRAPGQATLTQGGISVALTVAFGLPSVLPCLRARSSLAFVRSDSLTRSCLATTAKMEMTASRNMLVSRKGNGFRSFPRLTESIARALSSRSAVLDGEIVEIVCLDRRGKPQFLDLFARRGEPVFVAFDLLRLDGEDLRYVPPMERKAKLRALVSSKSESLMYCDHVETHGEKLFKLACKRDLEGIVAKRKYDPYIEGQAQWIKIRNTSYSQWVEREKLCEQEREADPDLYLWDACVMACEGGKAMRRSKYGE